MSSQSSSISSSNALSSQSFVSSSLNENNLRVKFLSLSAHIPTRAHEGDAGYDLYSSENVIVPARGRKLIHTHICVSIPKNTYGRVAPRSGLAVKFGLDVGAGVIDENYNGEIFVLLFNHSDADYSVKIGDRIAQLILIHIVTPEIRVVDNLSFTERGDGAFGSSGK